MIEEEACQLPQCALKELNVLTNTKKEELGFDQDPPADASNSYITLTYTFGDTTCSYDVGSSHFAKLRTLVDKECKNGQGKRRFLQDPFRWNAFSVHKFCRNFRIPCPFLYTYKHNLHGNRKILYSIAERIKNYTELQGISTESGRFCIPCQLGNKTKLISDSSCFSGSS